MASHIRELSEEERLEQQRLAREDYVRRLIGAYLRGYREKFESTYLEVTEKINDETYKIENDEVYQKIFKHSYQMARRRFIIYLVEDGTITIQDATEMLGISEQEVLHLMNEQKDTI